MPLLYIYRNKIIILSAIVYDIILYIYVCVCVFVCVCVRERENASVYEFVHILL